MAAPLYERALRELEAVLEAAPEENRQQTRDLAEIRNEYGLTLLRVAWTQSAASENGVDWLQESRRQLDLAMAIAGELDAPGVLAEAYNNLAGWYFVTGAESQVIDNLLLSRQHYERIGDSEALTRVSNNLGMMYQKLGELRAAQTAFHAGLVFAEQGAPDLGQGRLHFNVSGLYRSLGDLRQARDHAERSLFFFERAGISRSAMVSRSMLATQQRELGDPAAAFEQHSIAAEYFAAQNLSHDEATTRQELVVDLMHLGRLDDAIRVSEALLADESKYDLQASKLTMYANHALLLFELGREAEALAFATEKLDGHAENGRDPFGQIELMGVLRHVFASLGRTDEAIEQAGDMFALIEDQRTEFETLRLGPLWSAKTYKHYAEHVEFLLNTGAESTPQDLALLAFETIERARAVSFRQRRWEAILNRQQNNPAGRDEWRELVSTLLGGRTSKSDNRESERRFNVAREAFFAVNGTTIAPTKLPLLSVGDVQARLAPKQIVLSYFAGPESVWRYVIGADSWDVSRIGPRSRIRALNDGALYELTVAGSRSTDNVATLSSLMLDGVPLDEGVNQILFVPADGMHGLPFSAIGIDGKSVSDVAAITVVPSLSEYFSPPRRQPRDDRLELAVFADPQFGDAVDDDRSGTLSEGFRSWSSSLSRLPYSAREANMLRELYEPNESVVFTGREANRNNLFSEEVLQARVLHLATHGYFNEDTPELIGFALATDGLSDNGFVSMAEIAAQHIDAELVVISACDTARGRQLAGEGTLSLTRTFLGQGADSVISTLWPVSDRATALFMHEFYAAFKTQKLGLAESMRHAQLALKEHPRYKDPFYWSAYVLTSAHALSGPR